MLQLAEAIRSKATSRGCGPVLWKWVLKQEWRRSFDLSSAVASYCSHVTYSFNISHMESEDKRFHDPSRITAVIFKKTMAAG